MKQNPMHPKKTSTGNHAWSTKADGAADRASSKSSDLGSKSSDLGGTSVGLFDGAKKAAKSAASAVTSHPGITAAAVVGIGATVIAATKLATKKSTPSAT